MKRIVLGFGAIVLLGAGAAAEASIIGVSATTPDVTLLNPVLIYDHDGGGTGIGLLTVVASGSTIAEGAAAGGSTQSQSYTSGESPVRPDAVIRIYIDTATGLLVSSQASTVTIGFGNVTTAARFSWQGTITEFGYQYFQGSGTARIFDARWTLDSAEYQNMPAGLSQFAGGAQAGAFGGIIISNDATGTTSEFGSTLFTLGTDWVYGASVQNAAIQAQLAPYLGSMAPTYMNSSTQVDAFVPLPAAFWLLTSGLGLLAPALRRSRAAA